MKTITNNKDLFGWSRNAVFGSVAVLLLILGIATTAYFVGKKNSLLAQSPIPTIDLAARNPQVLGATVYNLNGSIIDINASDGELTVKALVRNEADQLQEKNILVIVKHDLEIIRWDVTQAPGDDTANSQISIKLSDLKPGNKISVQTTDDVRATDRVTAQAVSEMITPFSN